MDTDPTFRDVLDHIAANLETGDVERAKFRLGANDQLFPKGELEPIRTGLSLFELMIKKGFISQADVSNLDSLLKDINCGKLVKLLDPLKRKQADIEKSRWKVRLSTVPHFVKVHKCFELRVALEDNNIVILRGPPATGKTELACDYALEFIKSNPQSIIWKLDCYGTTEMIKSMTDLLEHRLHMKVEGTNDNELNYMEEIAQIVLDKLNGIEHTHLLIFDDIGDASCIGITSKILKRLQGNPSNVKIIATINEDMDIGCQTIPVDGLYDEEVVSFFRSHIGSDDLSSAVVKATEKEIRELAKIFENSPFGLMISKNYIQKSRMEISEYTDHLLRDSKFFNNAEVLEENITQYYKKHLLVAHNIVLERIESKLNNDGKNLLSYLPFLNHENISVIILKRLLRDDGHDYEDSNVIHRLCKYSLCTVKGLGENRVIAIHALTRRALWDRISKEDRTERILGLLKFCSTNMTMDCRLTDSLNMNFIFQEHAMHILRLANRNITRPSKETQILKCYVTALVGVTFRIGGVDNFLANEFLTQARQLCFDVVGMDSTEFQYEPNSDTDMSMSSALSWTIFRKKSVEEDSFIEEEITEEGQNLEKRVDNLFDKLCSIEHEVTIEFIRNIVVLMVRPNSDMDRLKVRAKGLTRFSFRNHLGAELYDELVEQGLAMPDATLRRFFLVELLIVILYNNGRNLYLWKECEQQSMPRCINELKLSLMLGRRLKQKSHNFRPVQYLITQRNGIMYSLLRDIRFTISEEEKKVKPLENAVRRYNEMLQVKEDYFEFGVLKVSKVSKNFHHTGMCLKLLIKCHGRLFELRRNEEEKSSEYKAGLDCVKKLNELVEQMGTWTAVPGFHTQIARFYMLRPNEDNVSLAIQHFTKADSIEEKITKSGLSHFRLQALFGLIGCYKLAASNDNLEKAKSICEFLILSLHKSNLQESLDKAKNMFKEIEEITNEAETTS